MARETAAHLRSGRFKVPSALCGAACAVLGATVLVGWGLGCEPLTRVAPGLISMKPNAALAFLLAGVALGFIREGAKSGRWAVGFSLAVTAIGGLTLFEYGAGVNLGIDEVLFREPPNQVGALIPGRMHPTTAFDLVLLGVASTLLALDRRHRSAQCLALLSALIAGSTFIGYLYGVRVFVGLAIFHQMALHTTLGLLVLSVGLLLARPRRGLMVSLADDGPSGRMARWLLPVAILMPLAIGGLTLLAQDSGLFDERYGSAVRTSLLIASFVGCIWRAAHALHRSDQERLRADSEHAEGQRRFRFLAEAMPQIVWVSRPGGEVEYLNGRWFDYTGHDVQEGWDWARVLHPDDLGRCLELWDRSIRSGRSYQGEFRFRRHDGAYRWHLARAEPMRDESGRILQWVGTSTDIDDQKRASEERYRSLVEATTAIVWNTPSSGCFESQQLGWGAFTGQDFEELKGWGWLDAIHPEDRDETARVWSAAVASRSLYQVMHRLKRHDGEYRHMVVRAVPLVGADGEIREWIGVHTDVDDQERAHEATRAAKEMAEAATRAKSEFLANMSHEIRTPMNGVLGMTELALATELTPRQREYLGLVKSSADALLTVIDDILDFSKIEAGKLTLEPIAFSLRDVVTDTLRCLSAKAYDKRLELACRITPGVPEAVVGDPGRLRQVLVNLVGNALKFTERGEVVVTVECDPDEAPAPAALRFSVADTGIGIPAEKRAAIFAPFEQADGSTTRKYGGTGLGLTISARLIELMGGRIWVEENPGGGSIFRFAVRLDGDAAIPVAPAPANPIVLDGLRVLIVDDNCTNRMILEEVLSQWGCRPLAVEGAAEAIRAMDRASDRGEPYPLALLDRMMPGMDGCDLARRIRDDPRHSGTRMLLLTSGGLDDSDRFRELGIGGRLAKPVRQSELLNAVLDLIGGEQAPARDPQPEPRPAASPPGRALRVLLAEDHPINQKVATRMLEEQGHHVTVAANGRLALEALASGPFDVILMDVQMPEMDGFEATAAIRAGEQPGGFRMPIIALTAHAMSGDRERCLASGFDGYLAKPIHAADLAEALGGIGEAKSGEAGSGEAGSGEAIPAFDHAEALDGLGGDESLLEEILGLFLAEFPELMGQLRLAAEAGDAATLKRLAHTLAGSASHLAAPGVIASARRLEGLGRSGDVAAASEAIRDLDREFERFREASAAPWKPGPSWANPGRIGPIPHSDARVVT